VPLQNLDRELSTANSDMTGHEKIRISTAISDPNIVTGFGKILF